MGWSIDEAAGEFIATAANGLGVQAGDGRDFLDAAVPAAAGFEGRDPPALLLIHATQDQIESAMVLRLGSGVGPAGVTGTLVGGAVHPESSEGIPGSVWLPGTRSSW